MYYLTMNSPAGPLMVAGDYEGLREIRFGDKIGHDWEPKETPQLKEARRQLEEYFAGKRKEFELILAPRGTSFQRRVWSALQTIPFGEVIDYGELSDRADCPRGSRAVGQANGRNPLPIVIPCHRVITHDDKLGGYSGGLDVKRVLLELEGITFDGSGRREAAMSH